jgi:hypothetical protein
MLDAFMARTAGSEMDRGSDASSSRPENVPLSVEVEPLYKNRVNK